MNKQKIATVKAEMKRLSARIAAMERALAERNDIDGESFGYRYNWPKETGAIRRASLDLTRALADLRRYS